MCSDPIDDCRRCGTPLLGMDRLEDLCPACLHDHASANSATARQRQDGDAPRGTKPYLVRWLIDVDATDALDAARQALAIQRDPASTATFFFVGPIDDDPDDPEVELDLLDHPPR